MSVVREIVHTLGLAHCPPFYLRARFFVALLAGGLFWLGLWLSVAVQPMPAEQIFSVNFFALVVWQPLLEELLFRGGLQGQLSRHIWGRRTWRGITAANAVTSLLFMLLHTWHHAPLWALSVVVPSLIFGHFRDCYTSVYPCIALHVFYNAGYFIVTGLPPALNPT